MDEPRLISDPESVDAGWLTSVLRYSGAISKAAAVASFEAQAFGTGQVGYNVRYDLVLDGPASGPDSVVVKFSSRDESSRAAGVQSLCYDREVGFYREIASTVAVARPYCHFAACEPGTADVVIVMEDLAPAQQGDQIAGCTVEQARLVVLEAAKLHGPRWGDPALLATGWLPGRQSADPAVLAAAFGAHWPGFCDRFRATLTPGSLEVGNKMVRDGWAPAEQDELTVCHGDYRLDNILFAPPGHACPVVIVDWQTVHLGVGTSDVSYFLGSALPPEDRRTWERDLIAGYHSTLEALGVKGYSAERCWDDYRRISLNGFFIAVFAAMSRQRTARGDAASMAMTNGSASQILDLHAFDAD